ncbi:hypothetical protein ABZ805_22830 [Saccharopolyspora sp. NPDC047091]|uniref:hypothetical protein n=1 Tax=Saccharopolyspora sp. NPDC047091 TaxID=3155924 RepID=UPI00340641B3
MGGADDVTRPNEVQQPGEQGTPGRMRFQDETTTPREPTLAEKRARIAAEKRQEEQAQAALAEQERKTQTRRRVMVGGGVTVGVVALVAAFYSASAYSQEQTAVQEYCATGQGQTTVQDPNMCDENYVQSHGGYSSGGMFFMPIFLPGGGIGGYNSYRYGYTSPGTAAPPVGQPVSSPNFTKPADANIKNTKGQTVQRGGFGISNKSGSSGS